MKLNFISKNNQSKKIPVKKLLLLFFILVLLLTTVPELIENSEASLDKKILFVIFSIIEISPFTLLPLIIYDASQRGKKKAIKESLSEIDFKKSKEYYREILQKYSSVELSYIDNFEINLKKDITATLLNLQLKKKITIKDNIIEVIDHNTNDLHQSETYILENIKNGKVKIYNPYELEGSAIKEALDDKLIIKNEIKNNNKKTKTLIGSMGKFAVIFWSIITLICIFNKYVVDFLNNVVIPNIIIIAPIIITSIILFVIFRYITFYRNVSENVYLYHKSKSYKRTEIGEDLNQKIEGLKNYLKDFSRLNEREFQELTLWEEYLIYSVIFNINTDIIKELSSLIELVN